MPDIILLKENNIYVCIYKVITKKNLKNCRKYKFTLTD